MSELLIAAANRNLAPYAIMYVTHNIGENYDGMWEWMLAEERSPIADFLVVSFAEDYPRYYELTSLIIQTLESKFGPYEQALEDSTILLQTIPEGEVFEKVKNLFEIYHKGTIDVDDEEYMDSLC